MNIKTFDYVLATRNLDQMGAFPHLDQLVKAPHVFDIYFRF